MTISLIKNILPAFGIDPAQTETDPLGNGLINHTYKVSDFKNDKKIVLQVVNTSVFNHPEQIQHNYGVVREHLRHTGSSIVIPAPVLTTTGAPGIRDEEGRFWRAFEFIENTFSPDLAHTPQLARKAAACFGKFTRELNGAPVNALHEILPHFHNLEYRYIQFREALMEGNEQRILHAAEIIEELQRSEYILSYFSSVIGHPGYLFRVMHHDTKVSNILFDKVSGNVICPVDLDTVMPGRFYSDIGDMIRTMACSADENCADLSQVHIRKEYYFAIMEGYLEEMAASLTEEELSHIHYAGLIMIYQQALRFLSDYLMGDVYYKTSYPDHNYNRAMNQFVLLKSLESFLVEEYGFPVTIPARNTPVHG